MEMWQIGLWLALSGAWGGVWWRFRGGALTTMTGFNPGTLGMRAIAAVAMGTPLAWFGLWWLTMIPALYIAWCLAGWGAFQGMGHETFVEEKNPVARTLEKISSNERFIDLFGMALEGLLVMTIIGAVPGAILHSLLTWIVVTLSGIVFAPIYFVWQWFLPLPNFGKFSRAGSEWAEVSVGAWVAIVVVCVVLLGGVV